MPEPDTPPPAVPVHPYEEPVLDAAASFYNAAVVLLDRPPVMGCDHLPNLEPLVDQIHGCLVCHDRLRCAECMVEHLADVVHPVETVCACCGLDSLETQDMYFGRGYVSQRVLLAGGGWTRVTKTVTFGPMPTCPHCTEVILRHRESWRFRGPS